VPPATARALALLAVAWANFSIPGRPLAQGGSASLGYLLPFGFVPVWHPSAGGAPTAAEVAELSHSPPPWPLDAGMFGYEVDTLEEIEQRCMGAAPAPAPSPAPAAQRARSRTRKAKGSE
jgi:hypothetical protein